MSGLRLAHAWVHEAIVCIEFPLLRLLSPKGPEAHGCGNRWINVEVLVCVHDALCGVAECK